VAAKLAGSLPVAWHVRNALRGREFSKWHTRQTIALCTWLSRIVPEKIIYNSHKGLTTHQDFGYAADKSVMIPNGFDTATLRPSPRSRIAMRSELDIPPDAPVVGLAGRFHPFKQHEVFVRAAGRIHKELPGAHFVMFGNDVTWQNQRLVGWINTAGIGHACRLLGRRDDVARLFAGIDVTVSSSAPGEGFPNVIGEAMACGVPCVVTESGDSPQIVGSTGRVVPRPDPDLLARACLGILTLCPVARRELGMRARRRVERNYDIPQIASRHLDVWLDLCDRRRHTFRPGANLESKPRAA